MEVNQVLYDMEDSLNVIGETPSTRGTTLRVKVLDRDGHTSVNVRMPIRVVKLGMRLARTFSPEVRDSNLDWDAITEMVEAGDRGELVHVEDVKEHTTVEVWVE
jgi:hypothetical protein